MSVSKSKNLLALIYVVCFLVDLTEWTAMMCLFVVNSYTHIDAVYNQVQTRRWPLCDEGDKRSCGLLLR